MGIHLNSFTEGVGCSPSLGITSMSLLRKWKVFEQCDEKADEAFYEWMKEFRDGFAEPPDLWSPASTKLCADTLERELEGHVFAECDTHVAEKLYKLLAFFRESVDGFYCT